MPRLIALKSGAFEIISDALNSDFSKLKQQSLLFDQIGILKLNQLYTTGRETLGSLKGSLAPNIENKVETMFSELEWLNQKGVVYELSIEEEFQQAKNIAKTTIPSQRFDELASLFNIVMENQITISQHDGKKDNAKLIKEQHFATLRLMTIVMELGKGVTAVTTFPRSEYIQPLLNSNKSEVAQIVINNLPLPSNETPWEQIIDYRNDPDSQKNLLNLRRWIRKTSHENLPLIEIQEEIEWLMNEFKEHMNVHKMKTDTESLEVLVKAPIEMLENLVTLKFSKLVDPLFTIKKRQLSLLEAEINAPGKEMAYIIKSKEAFQSKE